MVGHDKRGAIVLRQKWFEFVRHWSPTPEANVRSLNFVRKGVKRLNTSTVPPQWMPGTPLRSLGPVSVFAVQQLDGRLKFSGATLFCIAGFCIFPVAASVLRAWSEVREARAIDRIGGF